MQGLLTRMMQIGNHFYTIIGANGVVLAFEFHAAKSAANKLKHGMDFVEAMGLWLDEEVALYEG